MNNYITWVYNTLIQRVQAAESDISINGADITNLYSHVGYDGQNVYELGVPDEVIPANSDLNDYTPAGNYYCTGTSVATTLANCPTDYNFKLTTEYITGAFIMQTVKARDGGVFRRIYTISLDEWTDWEANYLNNISHIGLNGNGQLLVTRADGVVCTFDPSSLM